MKTIKLARGPSWRTTDHLSGNILSKWESGKGRSKLVEALSRVSQRWNSGRGVRESRVQFDWDKGRLRQLPREQRGRPWLDDKIQPFYRIPNGEFKKKKCRENGWKR